MKKIFFLTSFLFLAFHSNNYAQFSPLETRWCTGQGVGGSTANHWIGDFNGDGLDDKLQLVGQGDWWVALSNGYVATEKITNITECR